MAGCHRICAAASDWLAARVEGELARLWGTLPGTSVRGWLFFGLAGFDPAYYPDPADCLQRFDYGSKRRGATPDNGDPALVGRLR